MATVNFDLRGSIDEVSTPDNLVSGVDLANLAGVNQFDRVIIITVALCQTSGVPPGAYEHVATDSSGNWTYAPANRSS